MSQGAPKGNQFWKQRSRHGANPKFDNAQMLLEACCDYFEWCENNPLLADNVNFNNGVATHEPIAKMRVFTLDGLCLFIDISIVTWREWRKTRNDLSSVITWAEGVIKDNKFTGAAAGLLNANIISRDLGLADKVDNVSSDASMSPKQSVDFADMTPEQQREIAKQIAFTLTTADRAK